MAAAMPRAPAVYCPRCNGLGESNRVLSPMGVLFVEAGKPSTVQPYCAAHFTYVCPRCGFGMIADKLLE